MKPDRVGRKLGVGVRVASAILRDRTSQATRQAMQAPPPVTSDYAKSSKSTLSGIKRGTRKFGEAVWGPFAHAGSVLWLEITGLFFALFAAFFVQGVFRLRADWRTGPDHRRMLIYAAIALVFLYFAASSFYRARRKQRARKF